MLGINIASHHYDLDMAAKAELFRVEAHEVMANLLDEVDFIFCATNPDVAFAAEGPIPTTVGDVDLMERFGGDILRAGANQGNLTIPANFSGNPAVSIPAGFVDGLPVGMQVIGRHHQEELLLDLAAMAERDGPGLWWRPELPTDLSGGDCRVSPLVLSGAPARLWSTAGVGTPAQADSAHGQGLEAPQHDVLLVGDDVGGALDTAGPPQQSGDGDLGLETRQRGAQAMVDAEAEPEMVVVGAAHVEDVGIGRRRRDRGWPSR